MTKRTSEEIPVNPSVLRWARETRGLELEEVARRLGRRSITAQNISAWEDGKSSPNYAQLERLAYDIYKRPIALFFFPEPPDEETPKQSFRTLPEYEISRMPPRMLYLIRQARAMQANLSELNDGKNPAQRHIVKDLVFDARIDSLTMAQQVRAYLGLELESQVSWQNSDVAFKEWRDCLDNNGVSVFKESFNQRVGRASEESPFSGFCLYDSEFPIIYVNNSKPRNRQIFTLFHELCHLLFRTGGVDTRLDDYVDLLEGEDKRIEILCNRFAGSFLVPDDDFTRVSRDFPVTDNLIQSLAQRYSVSREVILRRFFDLGRVNQQYYEMKTKEWANSARPKRMKGDGGNPYNTKRAYLGKNYLNLAFSRYYQHRISLEQLAGYLGMKVSNIPKMESLVFG